MRHDAVIWASQRPVLKDLEHLLSFVTRSTLLRASAVITPLFHAAPDQRSCTPQAHRLRLITLENGDYQQIHNPGAPNFDELFAEWPRVMVHYRTTPLNLFDDKEHEAVLECHDLDTNWDKAGWTTGTTLYSDEFRKDRHKLILGFQPWGFASAAELETRLTEAASALAKFVKGSWEFRESDDAGHRVALEAFFHLSVQNGEPDPLSDMRDLEGPDVGRV